MKLSRNWRREKRQRRKQMWIVREIAFVLYQDLQSVILSYLPLQWKKIPCSSRDGNRFREIFGLLSFLTSKECEDLSQLLSLSKTTRYNRLKSIVQENIFFRFVDNWPNACFKIPQAWQQIESEVHISYCVRRAYYTADQRFKAGYCRWQLIICVSVMNQIEVFDKGFSHLDMVKGQSYLMFNVNFDIIWNCHTLMKVQIGGVELLIYFV